MKQYKQAPVISRLPSFQLSFPIAQSTCSSRNGRSPRLTGLSQRLSVLSNPLLVTPSHQPHRQASTQPPYPPYLELAHANLLHSQLTDWLCVIRVVQRPTRRLSFGPVAIGAM